MSEDESGGEVVSLAQRRARAEARKAEAARQKARQQARASSDERSKPWLTYGLMAVNISMWIVMVGAGVDAYEPGAIVMSQWGANDGLLTGAGQWWRLFTAMFLHYGIIHLACNMYFAWVFGRMTEPIFGTAAFAVIYFGSGVFANLVTIAWNPITTSAGASGALSAVFGAFLAFTWRRRSVLPDEYVRWVWINALILIGLNVVMGLTNPEIGVAAHAAGLVGGFGLGYLLTALGEKVVKTPGEAKAVRMRATAIAAGVSVLVAVAGALALPRWDDPRPVLVEIAQRHDELLERYQATQSPAEHIELIDRELLPFFAEAEADLREFDHAPAEMRDVIGSRVRYFELQQKAYALEAEGLRNNDPVVLAEAEDLHAEAIAALQ